MHLISKLDSFASPLYLTTSTGNTTYKTAFGGIFTVLLYSLSLLYGLFILINWQTGAIPPKVSSQLVSAPTRFLNIPKQSIYFSVMNYDNISLFSEKENIITPIFIKMQDGELKSKIPIFSETSNLDLDEFQLIQPSTQEAQEENLQAFLIFAQCDSTLLTEGQSCASSDKIKSILDSFGTIMQITIKLQQYDQRKDQMRYIYKNFYVTFEIANINYSQIYIQTTQMKIDRSMMMEDYQERTAFANNFIISTQASSKEFANKYFGQKVLGAYLFMVENIQTEYLVSYPKIGEILASIGSVAATILSLKFIFQLISQQQFQDDLVDMIIKLKYPKFNQIQIKKNIIGQTINVNYNNQFINTDKFKVRYNQAREEAKKFIQLNTIIKSLIFLQQQINMLTNQPINEEINKLQVYDELVERNYQKVHPQSVEQYSPKSQKIDDQLEVDNIFF